MKKIISLLMVAYSMVYGGIKNDSIDYKKLDKFSRAQLAKELTNEMVIGLKLPMKIDEVTQLVAIYNFNTTIIFKKKIDINNSQIKKIWQQKKDWLINFMLKQDSQNICYNPVWKYMIYKRDIIPKFNYVDASNRPLFSYTIEVEDCHKLK